MGVLVAILGHVAAATVAAAPVPDMLPTGDVQYPLVVTLTGGALGRWRGDVAVHEAAMGFVDGPRGVARFCFPTDLTFGPDGTMYVMDTGNAAIRVVTSAGTVTTLTGAEALPEGVEAAGPGVERKSTAPALMYRDGPPGLACFARIFLFGGAGSTPDPGKVPLMGSGGEPGGAAGPLGPVYGPDDCLYVADTRNHVIRRVDLAGNVTTLCGGRHLMTNRDMINARLKPVPEALQPHTWVGEEGLRDGVADQARFAWMEDLDQGPDGDLWLVDGGRLRRVTADGSVSTVIRDLAFGAALRNIVAVMPDGSVVVTLGTLNGQCWVRVASDGQAHPWPIEGAWECPGLAAVAGGCLAPDSSWYLSSAVGLHRIAPDGQTDWLLGGWRDGTVSNREGFVDGWCREAIAFRALGPPRLGPDGCLYAVDYRNHAIRKIIPRPPDDPWGPGDPTPLLRPPPPQEVQYPLLTTVWGRGWDDRLGDRRTELLAVGGAPEGSSGWQADMEFAADGTIYILCTEPFEVRRVVLDGGTEVVVDFAAALGVAERQSDLQAWRTWHGEGGLALSPDGSSLYVADPRTNQILGVTLADGGPFVAAGQYCSQPRPQHATTLAVPEDAPFQSPLDLAFGPDGGLYVVDRVALRRVSADGRVTKVADVTDGRCLVNGPNGDLLVALGRRYARVAADGRLEPLPGSAPDVASQPGPFMQDLSLPDGTTYLLRDGELRKLPRRTHPRVSLSSWRAVKVADAWDAHGLVLGPKREVILATERGNFLVLPTDELEPLPDSAAPRPTPASDYSDYVGAPGRAVATPDGTLYYLDGDRICRRSPDGKVQALIGDLFDYVNKRWYWTMGPWKPLRDGWRGLAQLEDPKSIVPGPDGALYVLELRGAIRRLDLAPPQSAALP
jgi:hypothetical protein